MSEQVSPHLVIRRKRGWQAIPIRELLEFRDLLNTLALARVSASTTAFYIFLQPFIAAVAGWLGLGEDLDFGFAMAASCVLAGLWCVVRRPARPA